jgi:hypothetical protein
LREKGARQESLKFPDSSISGFLCSSSGGKSMLEQGKALGPVSEAIMSLSHLLKMDHFSKAYVGSSLKQEEKPKNSVISSFLYLGNES